MHACNNPPHQQRPKTYAHTVKDGQKKKREKERRKRKYAENADELQKKLEKCTVQI
jgi:hypothetical protein